MSTEGFDPISLLVIVIFTALNDVKQIVALRKRFSVRNHFIKLINIHYILGKLLILINGRHLIDISMDLLHIL